MRSVYCEQLTNVIMRSVYVLGTMDKCLYFRSIYGEQWTNVIIRSVYCVRYNGQCYHALFLLGTTESLLRTVHTL